MRKSSIPGMTLMFSSIILISCQSSDVEKQARTPTNADTPASSQAKPERSRTTQSNRETPSSQDATPASNVQPAIISTGTLTQSAVSSPVPDTPVRKTAVTTATVEQARAELIQLLPASGEVLISQRSQLESAARKIADTAAQSASLDKDQKQNIEGAVETLLDRLGEAATTSDTQVQQRALDAIRKDLENIEKINQGGNTGPVG